MAFEKFTKPRGSFAPRVTIRQTGQIGLSQGTIRRFSLRGFEHCVLYYDKETNRIAISPTRDPNEEGAVKMTVRESDGYISAKAFLTYFDINFDKSQPYRAVWDSQINGIVIRLDEGSGAPTETL